MIYDSVEQVDFRLQDRTVVPRPRRVLLTTPEHFDVAYVINPHMAANVGTVDTSVAEEQWKAVRRAYEALGIQPSIVEGVRGLPDMVFCANQTLPYFSPEDDARGVVLSYMYAEERREEVPHFERFFRHESYDVKRLPPELNTHFEGMGDAIWHPRRYLLWGGYGFRTGRTAYEYIGDLLEVDVLLLHLVDSDFYHLDTCFSVLDEASVLVYPDAFDDQSMALIEHVFEQVVEAPDREARRSFACNAHCPDGEHVLIQEGCTATNERLRAAGFTPVELDTSEFIKAGGSIFCMKQMFW